MGLFGISRELQFGVCNHGKPCASSHRAREGELFYRGGKAVGRAVINKSLWLFIEWVLARKEEGSFSFLSASTIVTVRESSPLWSPNSTFFFFFKLFYLFIYLWLCWVFVSVRGLSLVRQVGTTLHRGARASHYRGLSCCGAQAPDAQAQ